MKKLVERKRRFDAKIAVLIATGLLAMPAWAQDLVADDAQTIRNAVQSGVVYTPRKWHAAV